MYELRIMLCSACSRTAQTAESKSGWPPAHGTARLNALCACPGERINGMKTGISRSKTGYRQYGRKNPQPYSVPVPVYPVLFSVLFPFIPKKRKRTRKYGIRIQTERDSSRPFLSLLATRQQSNSKEMRRGRDGVRVCANRALPFKDELWSLLVSTSIHMG
jgi:hypothetical protein